MCSRCITTEQRAVEMASTVDLLGLTAGLDVVLDVRDIFSRKFIRKGVSATENEKNGFKHFILWGCSPSIQCDSLIQDAGMLPHLLQDVG